MNLPPIPVPSAYRLSNAYSAVILPDDKSLHILVDMLIERSGLSMSEVARRLGIDRHSLSQYKYGRRRGTVGWLTRLAGVCGARVILEFPTRSLE